MTSLYKTTFACVFAAFINFVVVYKHSYNGWWNLIPPGVALLTVLILGLIIWREVDQGE